MTALGWRRPPGIEATLGWRRGADPLVGKDPGAGSSRCRGPRRGSRGRQRQDRLGAVGSRKAHGGMRLPDHPVQGGTILPLHPFRQVLRKFFVTSRDRSSLVGRIGAPSRSQSKFTILLFPAAWFREDSDSTAPQPPRGLMHSGRVRFGSKARGAASPFASGCWWAPRRYFRPTACCCCQTSVWCDGSARCGRSSLPTTRLQEALPLPARAREDLHRDAAVRERPPRLADHPGSARRSAPAPSMARCGVSRARGGGR